MARESRNPWASIGQYAYWTIIVRTCIIDEYIKKYVNDNHKTVINIGAGLDTRPYRMSLTPDLHWIEIDFPSIIELKNEKLAKENPKCKLTRIALDLADREMRQKVFSQLNEQSGDTLLITEGLVPYLDEAANRALAEDLRAQPNFKSWISEYYPPKMYPRYQAPGFQKLLGDSPFKFFPADWFTMFRESGWTKREMEYLYDKGMELGRPFPIPLWARLIRFFVGEERFAKHTRLSAYLVYERSDQAHNGINNR